MTPTWPICRQLFVEMGDNLEEKSPRFSFNFPGDGPQGENFVGILSTFDEKSTNFWWKKDKNEK